MATWSYLRGLKFPRKHHQARLPQHLNNNLRRLKFHSLLLGSTMPGQSEREQEESSQLPRLEEWAVSDVPREWLNGKVPTLLVPF